ncbi:hypothetical protein YC2023_095999 [Brassica napus]
MSSIRFIDEIFPRFGIYAPHEPICNRDHSDDCIAKFVIRAMRTRMARIHSEMVFLFMTMHDFDYIEKTYH